jgi:hypothetical protein
MSVSHVRQNLGGAAAAVTGAASGAALLHGLYELSQRIGETRFVQTCSIFLIVANLFLEPLATFFSNHDKLLWGNTDIGGIRLEHELESVRVPVLDSARMGMAARTRDK